MYFYLPPGRRAGGGPDNINADNFCLSVSSTQSFPGTSPGAISAGFDRSPLADGLSAVSPTRPVFTVTQFGQNPAIVYPSGDAGTDKIMMTRRSLKTGFACFATLKGDGVTFDSTVTTTGNCPMTLLGDTFGSFCMAFGFTSNQLMYSYKSPGQPFASLTSTGLTLLDGFTHTVAINHDDATGQVTLWADGAVVGTKVMTWDPNNTGFDRLGVGNANTDGITGAIAEIFAWDGNIDNATVTLLRARSQGIWGT